MSLIEMWGPSLLEVGTEGWNEKGLDCGGSKGVGPGEPTGDRVLLS